MNQLIFLPNYISPFKRDSNVTPGEIRAEMIRRILPLNSAFSISEYELERQEPSYSYDTLRYFRERMPDAEISFIIGFDSVLTIEKDLMNAEIGFGRKVLEVFEDNDLSFEHLPSGIDSVSLVVETGKSAPYIYQAMGDLEKEIKPDSLHVTDGMAVVAAVGRKMAFQPGSSGKIFAKLGENGINIRMITQGPEELNIIVGVDSADFEKAIRVLYNSFVK